MVSNKVVGGIFAGLVTIVSCVGINELIASRKEKIQKIAITNNVPYDTAQAYYNAGVSISYLENGRLEKIIANGGTSDFMKRVVDLSRRLNSKKDDFLPDEYALLENKDNDPRKKADEIWRWIESGANLYDIDVFLSYDFNFNDFASLYGRGIFSENIVELIGNGALKELVHDGLVNGLSKEDVSYLAKRDFDRTKTYSQQALADLVGKKWKVYEIEYVARDLKVPYDKVQAMINKGMNKGQILRKLGGK
jgi:hypothetical protein